MNHANKNEMPRVIRNRDIFTKIIPTVCNLKNMLNKLEENDWKFEKLKQWERRSYKAYKIGKIESKLKESNRSKWPEIIRENILKLHGEDIGASCLDIYFVAYVSENYGTGVDILFSLVKEKGISNKINSAKAIYQVGKGDGIYLGLLDDQGLIEDHEFFREWIR